ncbi:MAG: virulence RhuM family protein [Bacteroidales bacterium]|nr:virulence RhuM family protein [Bacteroidales bacterium]
MNANQNEIILYQPDNSVELEVLLENEMVWLSLDKMAELFLKNKSTISRHIKNVFEEKELDRNSTVAIFATVQMEGNRQVERHIEYFNLDIIISVGYRVKSQRGTQFRIWANRVLKDYLLKGYAVNQRIERLEHKIIEHDQKFDLLIKTSLPPKEGIFYDGQIFDAYVFVSDLIKSAKKSIVVIDNYIDESVLLLLSKRSPKISAKIYTKQIFSPQLQLDLTKHNAQYEPVNIYESDLFHDRFLLIDDTVYHIGASLKDLGKKLFAFSKMEVTAADILKNVKN